MVRSVQQGRPRAVISSRVAWLLQLVFTLFALLVVNSVYLASITLLEQLSGDIYEDYFYLLMFLLHLVLGLLLILPFLVFAWSHARRAIHVNNRYAIRAGLSLFLVGLLLLASGIVLTRFGFFEVNDPTIRRSAYWLHVISPLILVWLFVLHRLAGRPIRYATGLRWTALAGVFAVIMLGLHSLNRAEPMSTAEAAYSPSMIRTADGKPIPAENLMTDHECEECHADITRSWEVSMHRHSSFTNPAYRFSVEETREAVLARDGSVKNSRFCGGCHDIVPVVSGRFDQLDFDPDTDPSASAGLTCTSCHAITQVNSTLGNSDFIIQDPARYPFAKSDSSILRAVSKQLIRAKPDYHKKNLLKPHHRTAEFCSTCHKAHVPEGVNQYRWLRAQNHYDSFLQSGVSGHRVDSFYYPAAAVENCAACHMPLELSDDPAAKDFDGSGNRSIHNHQFAAANTAVPQMLGLPDRVNEAHKKRLSNVTRVDIFGLKTGGDITGKLQAPLRPGLPVLGAGQSYLLETVVRSYGVGHMLTQGTSDSNQLWLDVAVYDGDKLIGRSGGMNADNDVDPWSYFINSYVLDKNGNRIDRRNGQDMFVALYNHQIPPGAASVVHYALTLPADTEGPVTIEASLKYRKFDSTYLRYIKADDDEKNDLPVTVLATDRVVLPVSSNKLVITDQSSPVSEWERWNDYGIGLLREGNRGSGKGELRQAEYAFSQVEKLMPSHGSLNLARTYYKEGRLEDAVTALHRAKQAGAAPWTVAWFSALVDHEYGQLDSAIDTLEQVANNNFAEARERNFDFSYDLNLLNELGRLYYERGRQRKADRVAQFKRSSEWFEKALAIDAEDLTAHFNLALVYKLLGDDNKAEYHRQQHDKYRPDDHAIEVAVTRHRQANPAADHAASALVIHDLNRTGAYGMNQSLTQIVQGNDVQTYDRKVNRSTNE
mgnify:CR=1 FL=1